MKVIKNQIRRLIKENTNSSYSMAQSYLDEAVKKLSKHSERELETMLEIAFSREDNLMIQLIQKARSKNI